MRLSEFLAGQQVGAVEVLPDLRLINVVLADGSLFGVEVDDIPLSASVTTIAPATVVGNTLHAGDLSFDAAAYTMLAPLLNEE